MQAFTITSPPGASEPFGSGGKDSNGAGETAPSKETAATRAEIRGQRVASGYNPGGLVANGLKLEDAVKQIVALLGKDAELPELQSNVAEYKGRRFHAFSIPLPQTMRAG